MHINTRVRYAIRMMADLARHRQDEPIALKDVAQRQHLSKLYLSQLVAPLKRALLLRSVWGNKGGYALARPASKIRLLDIMEAVDGPVALIDCPPDPACESVEYCECAPIWRDINQAVVGILRKHTLAEFAGSFHVARASKLCGIVSSKAEVRHEFRAGTESGHGKQKREAHTARKG